jgi:DNA polymerase IIIc chi subunit
MDTHACHWRYSHTASHLATTRKLLDHATQAARVATISCSDYAEQYAFDERIW